MKKFMSITNNINNRKNNEMFMTTRMILIMIKTKLINRLITINND